MAEKLNVSRSTVRKAMEDLEKEGYLTRRRRVGTIVGEKLVSDNFGRRSIQTSTVVRPRVIVVLPGWDDSIEGFYSRQLLRALSSPNMNPPLAIEIRHREDPFIPDGQSIYGVVATDPSPEMVFILQNLSRQGVKVIVLPDRPISGVVNLYHNRRTVIAQAVKRFYQMGHKRVGIINGCMQHMDYENSYMGYLDAHRELDIPIHPKAIIPLDQKNHRAFPLDVRKISAWVCTYMKAVTWVEEECIKAGLSIPQDVSILSLDDPGDAPFPPMGKSISVETIDFDATALLIQNLFNDWQESRLGQMIEVPSKQIDRETIAPPRNRE